MARLAYNRVAWKYTADSGLVFRVAASKALTDQNKLGGAAAVDSDPPKPGWLGMRKITLINATHGISRTFPLYTSDAAILAPGTTINANALWYVAGVATEDSCEFMNDAASLLDVKVIPEKHGRKSPVVRAGNP